MPVRLKELLPLITSNYVLFYKGKWLCGSEEIEENHWALNCYVVDVTNENNILEIDIR